MFLIVNSVIVASIVQYLSCQAMPTHRPLSILSLWADIQKHVKLLLDLLKINNSLQYFS